jgi:hypothetical protein
LQKKFLVPGEIPLAARSAAGQSSASATMRSRPRTAYIERCNERVVLPALLERILDAEHKRQGNGGDV